MENHLEPPKDCLPLRIVTMATKFGHNYGQLSTLKSYIAVSRFSLSEERNWADLASIEMKNFAVGVDPSCLFPFPSLPGPFQIPGYWSPSLPFVSVCHFLCGSRHGNDRNSDGREP